MRGCVEQASQTDPGSRIDAYSEPGACAREQGMPGRGKEASGDGGYEEGGCEEEGEGRAD